VLGMCVIRAGEDHSGQYVFTVTDGGSGKRTAVDEYRLTNRNVSGVIAQRLTEARGGLVGALVVGENDEVMAIRSSGQVTRSAVGDVPAKSRATMGVKFVDVAAGDQVVAIARNVEKDVAEPESELESGSDVESGPGPVPESEPPPDDPQENR